MLTMNHGLAEAYVMRKVYKEKMKNLESTIKNVKEKEDSVKDYKDQKNTDGGCFPLFKKIHPNTTS